MVKLYLGTSCALVVISVRNVSLQQVGRICRKSDRYSNSWWAFRFAVHMVQASARGKMDRLFYGDLVVALDDTYYDLGCRSAA